MTVNNHSTSSQHFLVRSLDISCLENVNKCKTEGRHPSDHLHQQQRTWLLGCLPFPPKNMGQGFPGTTDCWNHEILTTHSTQGPAVGKHDTCIWTYMNIACRFACRICSWLQDTAGGAKSWPSAFTNQLYFAGAGHWSSPWLPETGERFTPCSEFHELYDVIWCYV